jgi:lysyl-tRNA synthetase class 1
LSETRIAKLSWKADWAMRWKHEGVRFEPGGADHATPGSSYTVSSVVTDKIFNYQAPLFVAYGMVGIQGQGGKMSGSKGNAITPGELFEFYDPQLLLWLYERKTPNQHFQLAFDSEIFRQYDEFDREFHTDEEILSFRQTVGLGQIVQFNEEKFLQLLDAMKSEVDRDMARARLPYAQNWLEKYNQDEMIIVRDEYNAEYFDALTDTRKTQLQRLSEEIGNKPDQSIADLEILSYAIPKEQGYSDDELKKEQRVFFKDVYNMLISADKGPRLGTFLWALDANVIQKLLFKK